MVDKALQSTGITGPQTEDGGITIVHQGAVELRRPHAVTYRQLRAIRTHPTIALARAVAMAPGVLSSWSVEKKDEQTPDQWVDYVSETLLPARPQIMETALGGGNDFGWQGWEKVFRLEEQGPFAGRITVKLKALLHDITEIMVEETGGFFGFRQERDDVTVPREQSLLVPLRSEAQMYHGNGLLINAFDTHTQWCQSNDGAGRYDQKIAGAHWVVRYPQGTTPVTTVELGVTTFDGTRKGNREIALEMISALKASGSVVLPAVTEGAAEWGIELVGDENGKQASFNDRLKYLDSLLLRAFLVPERSALEGQFGTKAESEAQFDVALMIQQMAVNYITCMINWHVVDQLLVLNYGEAARGQVWFGAAPLVDTQAEFLRKVYDRILENDITMLEESANIDKSAMRDRLDIPTAEGEPLVDPRERISGEEDEDQTILSEIYNDVQEWERNRIEAGGKVRA